MYYNLKIGFVGETKGKEEIKAIRSAIEKVYGTLFKKTYLFDVPKKYKESFLQSKLSRAKFLNICQCFEEGVAKNLKENELVLVITRRSINGVGKLNFISKCAFGIAGLDTRVAAIIFAVSPDIAISEQLLVDIKGTACHELGHLIGFDDHNKKSKIECCMKPMPDGSPITALFLCEACRLVLVKKLKLK